LQYKRNVRTLSGDVKFIGTRLKTEKKLVKGSLFFLLLKLVQINFILADNVRILSMYMDILVNDTAVKFVSTPCTDPLPSIGI
jgi:hypothetical protein